MPAKTKAPQAKAPQAVYLTTVLYTDDALTLDDAAKLAAQYPDYERLFLKCEREWDGPNYGNYQECNCQESSPRLILYGYRKES